MKKTQKLALRTLTLRELTPVLGGGLEPRPRTYGCPSNGVSCLPPKSEGCFTEVDCPTITQ